MVALKKSSGIVFSFCGFSKILQFVGRFHSIFFEHAWHDCDFTVFADGFRKFLDELWVFDANVKYFGTFTNFYIV